ncbi:Tudor-knot domain-containing protein [Deinococcus cellulosilyticus]|uniref:Tudor-knot domain-containing protein n=1 Tax=Deinococcus cellulosilyticus TaxID=401558 RepID=UPI0016499ECE|nr:Tudor-knot domain-containing protein [Deinococcus cellulosilyticus]
MTSVAWAASVYQVGQKVQVEWHGQWFDATIVALGTGTHQGKYKIHYEGYDQSWDEYVLPDRITVKEAVDYSNPAGRYVCMAYEASSQQLQTRMEFTLHANGTYQELWEKKTGKWSLKGETFQFTGVLNNKARATYVKQRKGMVVFDWGKGAKLDCYKQS